MKKNITILLALGILLSTMFSTSIPAEACSDVDITKEDVDSLIDRLGEIYGDEYPQGEVTFSSIKDISLMCGMSSTSDNVGAVGICKIDNLDGYLVLMGATEVFNFKENNGIKEDILSAFNLSNEYKNNTVKYIKENIPKGANIYIYGYSLGGMVMQQVISDRQIKKDYNIEVAVAIGSPVVTINREKIIFIEDSSDVVPYLSIKSLLVGRLFKKYDTHIEKDGGYKTTIGAHALSYVDSSVWDNIDVFGMSSGNTLTINMDNFTSFFV